MITQTPEKFNHHAHATRTRKTTMTLKLKQPRLSVYLRALCGRAANERSKARVWADARSLRQFAQQRLAEGATEVEVVGWLASEIAAAQQAQAAHRDPDNGQQRKT